MRRGEMPGRARKAPLPRSSPGCFGQGALQSGIKRLRCARVLYLGVPPAVRPSRRRASPSPPACPGAASSWPAAASQGRQQLQGVPSFSHWLPAGLALSPLHPPGQGDPGSQDELPLPSASQTITQAPDQRSTSVEYPFCLHSVSHALIALIKAVLILTSPLVPPLSCSDLIIFLATSAGAAATKSHPLHSQQDFPAPLGSLD